MSRRLRALVALFVTLQAAAALLMLAQSVHAPDGLAAAAPVYFVIAAGLTWWVAHRFARALPVLGTGLLTLAAAPGVYALLDALDRFTTERRIAATRVDGVRDEPILSASGRPIGVRLTYTVSVPKRGYFAIYPSLVAASPPRGEQLQLNAVRWTIDGTSDPRAFEPGKTHAMVVELYPPMLFVGRGNRCLAAMRLPALPDTAAATPLRVTIHDTPYGDVYRGGQERVTINAYDLGELYRGVLAENLPPCQSGD